MPLRVFPVAPEAKPVFSDDFGAPRSGGRTHEGCDIFAPLGSPLLAVDDGKVTREQDQLGGNVVVLQADDGVRYSYAHLSAFPAGPGLQLDRVRAGDVVGFVGDTGNAKGGPPHLHLEVHPDGRRGRGTAVNPFPLLVDVAPPGAAPRRRGGPFPLGPLLLLALVWYSQRRRA